MSVVSKSVINVYNDSGIHVSGIMSVINRHQ